MAADTVWTAEHDVDIYSKKVKSEIAGAQFMHARTGWYCSFTHDFEVDVIKSGTARGYALNVYGDAEAKTSWNSFSPGKMFGWDMKAAYDRLWDRWHTKIEDAEFSHEFVMNLLAMYDKVISSIPLPILCYDSEHSFKDQLVHIVHGPAQHSHRGAGDIMYYNGVTPEEGGFDWYRFSQLNNYQSWEHRESVRSFESLVEGCLPEQKVTTVKKAVSTDCECYDGIVKIGRYGCWDKNILTHHVREQVLNALLCV